MNKTTIQCPQCKAYLSVKGLVRCPLCETPLPATEPTSQANLPSGAPRTDWRSIVGWATILSIVAMSGSIIFSIAFPSKEKLRSKAISEALVQCQFSIQNKAQLGGAGESELPPYTPNMARAQDDEFYFAWPKGNFFFKTVDGIKIPLSASCQGTLSPVSVKMLTINGIEIP